MGMLAGARCLVAAAAIAARLCYGNELDGVSPEPPVLPEVLSLSFSGNGCPQGTAEAMVGNASWTDWSFSLHKFNPEDSQGRGPADRTQNCGVHANIITRTPGWQLSVRATTMRGFASLSNGSALTAFSTVFWSQDASNTVTKNITYLNSGSENLISPVTIDLEFDGAGPWTPCVNDTRGSAILNVNFRIAMRKGGPDGYASFGGITDDGNGGLLPSPTVLGRVEWMWRRCGDQPASSSSRTQQLTSTLTSTASPTASTTLGPITTSSIVTSVTTSSSSTPSVTSVSITTATGSIGTTLTGTAVTNTTALTGSTISQTTLTGSTVSQTTVTGTSISEPTLSGTHTSEPTLTGTRTSEPTLTGTRTSEPTLTGTRTSEPTLTGTRTSEPTLTGTYTSEPTLTGTRISEPTLTGTRVSEPTLTGTRTSEPTLTGTHISEPTLTGTATSGTTVTASTFATVTTWTTTTTTATIRNSQPLTMSTSPAASNTQPLVPGPTTPSGSLVASSPAVSSQSTGTSVATTSSSSSSSVATRPVFRRSRVKGVPRAR